MHEMIKSYKSYASLKRHGIRCEVNRLRADYPLHRHDYFELELVKEGDALHRLNGAPAEVLTKGEIIALSPKDLHSFEVSRSVEICNLCICYKDAPAAIQQLLSRVELPRRGRLSGEALGRALQCFDRVAAAMRTGGEFEAELVTAYVLLLLTELLAATAPLCDVAREGRCAHIADAMTFIADNLEAPLSLGDVANSVHLTPSYLSGLFARIAGKSFLQYLTEQRVERARRLLATTNVSVTDIAFAVGFGSFCAFSRAFRRLCGMTPTEFRKFAKTV